ncbi:MAG: pantetheine-phosphate adenylyltransferase [Pseudomonadota bacterium]|nr:pantetheine-phosphate adenylyltransferase [Gammaproteobacteria bacterium]MEC9284642.1 pantetheine-phosphate adenylyltransferase [Pseudomonadota bacterium]HBP14103.1 pantetheine-phosphate adenylyltransferase [Gammaproteobacteria bacterium]
MSSVIYPGSFNPITHGHTNIVERALSLFDHVVVAIGTSVDKDPATYLADRMELCRIALTHLGDQVSVEGFNGLLVDYVRSKNTRFVLRGLRTLTDYDYEFQMLSMNQSLDEDIEYVLLPTAHKWSFLSSSRVREIAALGGDISNFVHPAIVDYYKEQAAS